MAETPKEKAKTVTLNFSTADEKNLYEIMAAGAAADRRSIALYIMLWLLENVGSAEPTVTTEEN